MYFLQFSGHASITPEGSYKTQRLHSGLAANERTRLFVLEIVAVVGTLLVGLSIAWSTARVGISPTPSSRKARDAIIRLMADTGTGPVYDLGSGWGGLAIRLAKDHPDRKIVGYEVSFVPWLVSVFFKNILRLGNLEIYRKNFLLADLSGAAVLVCFLHTDGMREIAKKLTAEEGSSGFLISNYFALPSCQPETSIQINDFYNSPMYRYRLRECI